MDKTNFDSVLSIAKQYAEKIRTELDPSALVYLFGSVVYGEVHERSDIDVAVVSRVFTNDVVKNYTMANRLAIRLSTDMEVQAIPYEDWLSTTPLTEEVRRRGVLIEA